MSLGAGHAWHGRNLNISETEKYHAVIRCGFRVSRYRAESMDLKNLSDRLGSA